ncbi:MAG: phosphomannomutase/phosphoglucomutase, partial [Pseudomonadota bacterium]|nr:phosphomannomutase/phosphoglucomutase [Pseudomonadota bacterium]
MGKKKNNDDKPMVVSAMKHILPLMITGVVVIVLSIGGLFVYQSGNEKQALEQSQATALAAAIANQVQGVVNEASTQLDLLAERPEVENALANNTLKQFNASPHLWQPDATLVLVPRRGADTSQFSYTAQELLKEVRLGQQPAPVVIAGQPPELVIARATKNQNGTLLLTRSLKSLATLVGAALPGGSQLEIKFGNTQIFSNHQTAGGARSTASAGTINATVTLPRADSQLIVLATGAIALSVVLLLVATLVVNRLLARALRQDAAELIRYSDELARQPGVTARNHFHFGIFRTVNAAHAKTVEKVRERAGARKARKAPEAAAMEIAEEVDDGILLTDDQQTDALPEEIFRAYDIRGVAGVTLTAQAAYLLGRAIGTEASDAGQQTVLVARDGRLSSPELTRSLIKGLLEAGRDVIDLGLVPSPVLYYATEVLETQTGIMVTGSHNPPSHNGMKIVINGETLFGDRIQAIKERIRSGDFSEGRGKEEQRDITDRYLNDVVNDIVLARPLKIAIDCGNGATGELAPRLFTQLGCEVTPLYTDIDGNFPNHAPDPGNPDNLQDLVR